MMAQSVLIYEFCVFFLVVKNISFPFYAIFMNKHHQEFSPNQKCHDYNFF